MTIISSALPSALLDRLATWARLQPQSVAWIYLAEGETPPLPLDYGTLFARINRLAAWLSERVAPGERVLLAAHSEANYLLGLLACLRASVVAVPTLTSLNARALERLQAHGEDAGACALLTDSGLLERRTRRTANAGAWIQRIPWLNLEEADTPTGASSIPAASPLSAAEHADGPAYLQYTSGSTSRPKGVIVTHANLAAQLSGLERVFDHRPASVICNWMPLFHDFGLVMSLQGLYSGGTVLLMPAVPTVQRPRRWLQAMSDYRAVTSAAPNFMFERCVERISLAERQGLDLSAWQHALSGAEPIRPSTLRAFSEYFQSSGFRESAWMPAYGLAEATLVVSIGTMGKGLLVESFDADALLAQRVMPSLGHTAGKELVGCGMPLVAGSVHIVDPERALPVASGVIGEVWLASPSVTAGYWERASESAETFGARLADAENTTCYLRTGDLGFLWQDVLFIAGRLKDLIIVRGENHYPQDIELTVAQSHVDLEPNAGAAFALDGAHGEVLVVVQEVRREALQRCVPEILCAAIRHAVAEAHGLDCAHIVLLRTVGLPRTSSGKVQRRACRLAWQAGQLPVLAEWHAVAPTPAVPEVKTDRLEGDILAICQHLLSHARIDPQTSLFDYGVDSLKAAEILLALEERWQIVLDLADFAEYSSVALLARTIRAGQKNPAPVRQEVPFCLGDPDEAAARSPNAEALLAQIQHYVASWAGERAAPDSLLVGHNTQGKNCPLFWVFQGQQELAALAERLGPEQPVYGMRSGHQVMDYSESNIQILATRYRREIVAVHPQGPYLLGGNCQGGLITLAIAQQFWRLQQPVTLLCLLEWAFPPQVYPGRVAFFWGESSWHKNPFFKFHQPDLLWRRAFGAYSTDIVSGGHGEFFSGSNLDVLADKLLFRLQEALAMPPLLLPPTAYCAAYRPLNLPALWIAGQRHWLKVELCNLGSTDWAATERSGLQLGNHWLDAEQQVVRWLDGVVPLARVPAGGRTTVILPLRAPSQAGTYLLQLDLVEEGVAWFSERGVAAASLPITVVSALATNSGC